jgi:hypothetical protein
MNINGNIRNNFGALNVRAFKKMADKVNERSEFDARSSPPNIQQTFVAYITGNVVVITGRRWKYTWGLAHLDSSNLFEQRSGASLTYTNTGIYAYNTVEALQQTSGTKNGPGFTHANIPSGYTLQPIATGTCVHMLMSRGGDSLLKFTFCVPNAIDGTCP